MRNALKVLTASIVFASLGACNKQDPQADQNVAVDINSVSPNDIEALPPDESSDTPSDQLANGDDNPDVNDLNSTNSY